QPDPGLHLQRDERPAVDRRIRQHPAGAWQLPGRQRRGHRERHPCRPVSLQRHRCPSLGTAVQRRTAQPQLRQVPRRHRIRRLRHPGPDLGLRRHLQPAVEAAVERRLLAAFAAVGLLCGLGMTVAHSAKAATGATGPITGYEGLCLDDRSASTADFNPIQVYTCNGTSAQQWTVAARNTLQVLGMCLDVNAGGTANGTLVDLYTCNGTAAQVWQPQSNGELINPNSGKCLDDTGFGGSGTQVQIWACADSSNQQWTLPSGGTTPPPGNAPNLGPNVYVFTLSMSTSTIQGDINAVYNTQQSNQFGTQRYELMFEPGTYNVSVPVGFYTE